MFDELKEQLQGYYQQLSPRERTMVLWGGVAVGLIMFYSIIWYPIINYRDSMAQAVTDQQETLTWMRQSAAEVRQLGGARGSASGESIMSVVDRTARLNKLADSLKRVEPEGENRVRAFLEQAAFDDMVTWLEHLQNENHIRVESLSVDKESTPGRVSARLVLESTR